MGNPITYKVEIEFIPNSGILVDVSSRVELIEIDRPRANPGTGGLATTVSITIQNHPITAAGELAGVTSAHIGFCPFSPDAPTTPYYPDVTRDRRFIITAFWAGGASSGVRMFGWTDPWTSDAGERPPGSAMVTMTGSCILSRYARRRLLSVYGEVGTKTGNNDYYPFDDAPDSLQLRGVTGDGAPSMFPARVIQPSRLPGSATLGAPDGGHLTDGQIDFTRGDDNAPAPVVLIPMRPPGGPDVLAAIGAWFRLTNDPAGALGDDFISGYDVNGDRLWVWGPRLIAGKVQWTLYDNAGVARSFFGTNAPRDDGWHFWNIRFLSSTDTNLNTADKGESVTRNFGSIGWTYDPRPVAWVVLGGQMRPQSPGKQTNTAQGSMSSVLIQYNTSFTYMKFGNPAVVQTADDVTGFLNTTTTSVDSLVGGAFTPTPDTTPIVYTGETKDLLERWNEHARSVSGGLITMPSGARRFLRAEDMRPTTVALQLEAEQDLSAPDGGWGGTKEDRPTRITVTSPLGSYQVVDTATEADTGLQLEGASVATSCGSDGAARSVAGMILNNGQSRLVFGVDLTTTSTSKVTAAMAMRQHDRIRVTNIPAALEGITQKDVYASGWKERYVASTGECTFTFDGDIADDPPEARFDDADNGRFAFGDGVATVTGGTALTTTGTGTLIITTSSVLTTDPTMYPMDLDWLGERITVSGVGGAVSPQTVTVTARGVAPSVARVHVAGEPIEIWHAARFGA